MKLTLQDSIMGSGPHRIEQSSDDNLRCAFQDIREGRFVLVINPGNQRNEGALIMAAERVTPADINFMAKHCRGTICIALTRERIERLRIPMMIDKKESAERLPLTVSVEARSGVTSGVSAADGARTVQVLIDPNSVASDIVMPGHMFPLRADDRGVLGRPGYSEAAVDLCRLAGCEPAAMVCGVMRTNGQMARLGNLRDFARRRGIRIVSLADVAGFRLEREAVVVRLGEADLRNSLGQWRTVTYESLVDDARYIAMVKGEVGGETDSVLVRLQAFCFAGDVLGSEACPTRKIFEQCLAGIGKAERGLLVYVVPDRSGGLECGALHQLESQGELVPEKRRASFRQILENLNVKNAAPLILAGEPSGGASWWENSLFF